MFLFCFFASLPDWFLELLGGIVVLLNTSRKGQSLYSCNYFEGGECKGDNNLVLCRDGHFPVSW